MHDPDRWPPLFLFIHTYDIHAPYDAPEPYSRRFSRGSFEELKRSFRAERLFDGLNQIGELPAPEVVEELRGLYDNGIAWTDESVSVLFKVLQDHRLYEEAIIVVLSDHGEELYEHGGINHGSHLYQEQVRVPLMIRLPNARYGGRVLSEPVALIDVAPTVMELAGFSAQSSFAGISLVERIEQRTKVQGGSRPIFFETPNRIEGSQGILVGRWKLIRNEPSNRIELYDLDADPGELNDIAQQEPVIRDRMAGDLARWVHQMEADGRGRGWFATPSVASPELSAQERETLRVLGYVE